MAKNRHLFFIKLSIYSSYELQVTSYKSSSLLACKFTRKLRMARSGITRKLLLLSPFLSVQVY
jgi:hypothetical protein